MILVLGASSQIGYYLLQILDRKHYPCLAVSRNAPPAWGVARDICWLQHDLDESALHSDASTLISAGALRHVAKTVRHMPRVNQVIAISSSSISNKRGTQNPEELAVIDELVSAELALEIVCEEKDIPLTILRPTLVYGCGLDKNLSRIVTWLRKRPWFPIAGKAQGLRQPVHAEDIAQLCLNCVDLERAAAGVFSIGGAEPLPYKDMVRLTAHAIERPLMFLPLPARLLAKMLDLVAKLPSFKGLNGAMVERQNQNLVVDHRLAQRRLQWRPRAFAPDASCFMPPESLKRSSSALRE